MQNDLVPIDHEARDRARTSSTLGTLSIVLCLVAPCASCLTLFFALPLSLVSIQFARTAMEDSEDELTIAYGRNGMTLGVIALIYTLIMLFIAFCYVMLYVVMFGAIFAGTI